MSGTKASTTTTTTGPLTVAAAALEGELGQYLETSAQLERIPINSDKTLQRARKVLEDCAKHQEKLAVLLPAFAQAMNEAQRRQTECMEETARGTARIKARFDDRMALLERVAALGERAQMINQPIASMNEAIEAGSTPQAILKSLDEVSARTEAVIGEAEAVHGAATEADWQDIARDADALKQQLQSARNRILIAQRTAASRAPS
jgi:chromosome segregation ATPase